MSAHAALRLAVRPARRAAFEQLTAAALQKPLSQRPSICLHCSIAVNLRPGPGRPRLFSTAPPPPRQPPPPQTSPDEKASNLEPESKGPHAPPFIPTPPLSEQPAQPKQPEPEPEPEAAPSSTSSEPSTPPSSSEPASPDRSEPSQPTPPPPETNTTTTTNNNTDPSLPSFTETHRHPLSARFSTFMDNLQSRALTATQTINDLTGYSAIEAIKARNTQLEHDHAAAQRRLRNARHNYKSLNAHRAATQREVTTLLARQATWTPPDLERFTTLYRLDHELETQVTAAAAELTEAETDEAKLSGELNAGILKRYHEEQIWSDRIRRQSTWGTWGLMGVNVVMFLVLQFVAEPWRRKRLMRGIAESEKGVMDEVRRELEEVRSALEASGLREAAAARLVVEEEEEEAAAVAQAPVVESKEHTPSPTASAPEPAAPVEAEQWEAPRPARPWKEVLVEYWEDPELLREAVLDLSSDRRIDLRMRDASLIALQGAAAGATLAVVVAVSLLRYA